MMDTILDLGLNDATEAGLARASGDAAFARSCRERFEAMLPLDRRRGRRPRRPVGAAPARDRGRLPVVEQRPRPRVPREGGHRRRPRDRRSRSRRWSSATAAPTSATGVAFTRNPATGEPTLYGDVLFDAQGEDVVAGTHATEPIAALDERLPAVAAELRERRAPPRAPLRRPLRHRVHDRGRPAVVAPGPGRQAQPAGRAADRRRHGRGPRVPAVARGGGRAGRVAAGRSTDDDRRPDRRRDCRS